jgi:WD40 repeat protein
MEKEFPVATTLDQQGKWIASAYSEDGVDVTVQLRPFVKSQEDSVTLHGTTVGSIVFGPKSKWLVSISRYSVQLWDIEELSSEPKQLNLKSGIASVKLDSQGQRMAIVDSDNMVRLWQLNELDADPQQIELKSDIRYIQFDSQDRWLAIVGSDQKVRLCDLSDPKAELVEMPNEVSDAGLAFDPKGRWMAAISADQTVLLWSLANRTTEPEVLPGLSSSAYSIAVDPQGQWLTAICANDTGSFVQLWNLEDLSVEPKVLSSPVGIPVTTSSGGEPVENIIFDRQGRWLAIFGPVNDLLLWDLTDTKAQAVVLSGHEATVSGIAFDTQNKWLATATEGSVRLWKLKDLKAEPVILSYQALGVTMSSSSGDYDIEHNLKRNVVFDSQSQWLASVDANNISHLWNLDLDKLMVDACETLGRNLTCKEQEDYLGGRLYEPKCKDFQVQKCD